MGVAERANHDSFLGKPATAPNYLLASNRLNHRVVLSDFCCVNIVCRPLPEGFLHRSLTLSDMADFKTHISTSTMLGIGYGVGAYFVWDIPAQHCVIAAGLCSVAGMLPDLDSDTGVPVRETLCFLSVLIPVLMIPRFQALGMSAETIVFASLLIYVGFRFGVGKLFKKYTKHRGMWHSIPAAMIAGLATFIVCLSPDLSIRLFKSWAVVLGFMSHLVLDEMFAVDLYGRKLRVKKSFGTALKFFSKSTWANISTYGKLALLILIILGDAKLMEHFDSKPLDIPVTAREWIGDFIPVEPSSDTTQLR